MTCGSSPPCSSTVWAACSPSTRLTSSVTRGSPSSRPKTSSLPTGRLERLPTKRAGGTIPRGVITATELGVPMSDEKLYVYPDSEIPAKLAEHGLTGWYLEDGWLRRKYNTDGWPT